jgi:hypothetical protein
VWVRDDSDGILLTTSSETFLLGNFFGGVRETGKTFISLAVGSGEDDAVVTRLDIEELVRESGVAFFFFTNLGIHLGDPIKLSTSSDIRSGSI